MKLQDLLEGDVIKGKFGKNIQKSDVDIPKGYDSFYAKKLPSGKGGQIIGVKSDKSEVVISTTSDLSLADMLAKEYNSDGKGNTGIQPMSMMQAFGSSGLNTIHDLGITMIEKPSSFEEIREDAKVNDLQLRKLKKQMKIKIYFDWEIFGKKMDDTETEKGPLMDAKFPKEETFIIEFYGTDNHYLVDTTGASSYIRNWAFIG